MNPEETSPETETAPATETETAPATETETAPATETETAPATEAESDTPAAETEPTKTTEEQILEAIDETNRLLGVLAEQGRNDGTTQSEHNEKLETISTLTTTTIEKLDLSAEQHYETGWLLAFVIVFTISFKSFFDHAQRW